MCFGAILRVGIAGTGILAKEYLFPGNEKEYLFSFGLAGIGSGLRPESASPLTRECGGECALAFAANSRIIKALSHSPNPELPLTAVGIGVVTGRRRCVHEPRSACTRAVRRGRVSRAVRLINGPHASPPRLLNQLLYIYTTSATSSRERHRRDAFRCARESTLPTLLRYER